MHIKILISFLISFTINAQPVAIQGEQISADKINSSSLQIGDIKQSILNLTQFQSLHGDCWVLMDGNAISGSDLSNLTGMTNVPDARGNFLRMANNGRIDGNENPDNKSLGEFQSDSFKEHYHHQDTGYSGSDYLVFGFDYKSSLGISGGVFNHADGSANKVSRTSVVGGSETRPKNVTVNFFIKINTNCSFN